MKNILIATFIFLSVFVLNTQEVFADALTAPIVSIGVGNSNFPENTGPTSSSSYYGDVQVYATITDSDLDNYHFRVVKDEGTDGYTCTDLGALFASGNQGYASTTLSLDACGFVFNQSVYASATGFTNTLIATLNTEDIIAFGGEGDYWLILGAIDTAGNRTNSNYLNDAKVKIKVSATAPIVPPAPVAPVASAGGGGGNGPIVGSFGGGNYSAPVVANNTTSNSQVSDAPMVATASTVDANPFYASSKVVSSPILADGGLINANQGLEEAGVTTSEVSVTSSTTNDNLAQAVSSGFNFNWLWIILAILGLGAVIYYFSRETK